MKKFLLLLVLAALIGVAVVAKKQKEARLSEISRRGVQTRELLLPGLDVNAIKTVHIKSKDHETHLKQTDKGWTVSERQDYAADFEKLSQSLMELRETKIAGKQLIGKSAWSEVEVLDPAEGATDGTGTLVKLLDAKGGEVAAVVLGKEVEVSGTNNAQFGNTPQRLVRIPADEDSLWMVNTAFGTLSARPEDWLDKSFLAVQDMKSLSVTPAQKEEAWSVNRPSKDVPDYTLDGAKEGEELDSAKLSLASLLSSASFNDVKPKSAAGDLFKDANKAQITTFDGFTYDLAVAKQTQDGADKHFMTVSVKANLPKERKPGKDEKEEDKKSLDEEFKAGQDLLKEKLEKEQKLSNWVFEVAEYTINNLLKARSEIVKAPEPAADPEAPDANPAMFIPGLPGAPAAGAPPAVDPLQPAPSVTTPPVAVPPAPKPEQVKPAPAPDANPAKPE